MTDAIEAYERAAQLDDLALHYARRCVQEQNDAGGPNSFSEYLRDLSTRRTAMARDLRLQALSPPRPWPLLDEVRRLQREAR